MSLLVTGGQGFVMSNLVRAWLESRPAGQVTVLDAVPPDDIALRFFAGFEQRISWITADIRDRAAWPHDAGDLTAIVHGAAVTPHPWTDADGARHEPEREDPERVVDINLGGTLAALDFARRLPGLKRFLLVSTGSVYGDEGPTDRPLPEDGWVAPTTLYGISKLAAEQVARRYGELYGLPVTTVRLASVFGPMDRLLPSRRVVCAPNRVTALALSGDPIRLSSAEAVGDWIDARDVATAILALLAAERPRHPVYNVASGRAETLGHLAELTCRLVPSATWAVDATRPNLVADPARRLGQWGAYDIGRLSHELGWAPEPLEARLASYVAWRRLNESLGGPS